ncbi:3-hydroxyacyl-[acyl-carrier-protein] dehydratase FabZ [Oenococcus oeni]|uniref:3-hydroxyacyl-ACP dehydratase FabZ n=1 Tax=Oenococcus oeni TaxID=1247 RepID=UPI0008F91C50|nr:3-hydroxyacyl-ACP dehydratase FabZ [Oenococcus oeni]OIL22256.1 3-hydroxyacyl-[acyl-carrier-protein] dehydratase FabZ [Oenococcus oeni]
MTEQIVMTATEIQKVLPNRYPMLMVDRVLELVSGERILAQKNVTINEEFFQGHFPGNPVMPGVLIVEALAQAGAIALLKMDRFAGKTPYFGGVDKVKFRRMVRPGDTLTLNVTLDKLKDNIGSAHALATVDGEKACSADLLFLIK